MIRYWHLFLVLLLLTLYSPLHAQQPEGPVFVNEGETVVYHLSRDPEGQKGTVSDALQNVPGVKVDTEGNITLRGVNQVEIFIDGKPSHFDGESQKNYLQQVSASSIERIEVMTNPSARYTTATDTGVINIITDGKDRSERHLSAGFQVNTQPNLSPWLSYIWSNRKAAFTANLKGSYFRSRKHTETYSYSFVNPDDTDVSRALDTANIIRSYSDDTTNYYALELFLKGEFHPNDDNDFMVFFNIAPQTSRTTLLTSTYRKEFLNAIGTYEYTILEEFRQPMSFGSAGASWHHRFPKKGHDLSVHINSDYDFGGSLNTEIRNFKNQPWLNRNIRQTNSYLDIGNETKVEYTYPYDENGELYVSLNNNFRPDNNIGLYDTLGVDGYINDALRSENRKFSRDQMAGFVLLQPRQMRRGRRRLYHPRPERTP